MRELDAAAGAQEPASQATPLPGSQPAAIMVPAIGLASGNLLASKTIPVHSGFHSVKNLAPSISPS